MSPGCPDSFRCVVCESGRKKVEEIMILNLTPKPYLEGSMPLAGTRHGKRLPRACGWYSPNTEMRG